jgi:hypothetical protein
MLPAGRSALMADVHSIWPDYATELIGYSDELSGPLIFMLADADEPSTN